MRATPSLLALSFLLPPLAAQTQSAPSLGDFVPSWPGHLETRRFAPFVDGQARPAATRVEQAGSFDFDGDGNEDLWFLDSSGKLQICAANTGDLLRFRSWAALDSTNYSDVATYRSRSMPTDRLLAVDPSTQNADMVYWFSQHPLLDPRIGKLVHPPSYWSTGSDAREIETADHNRDGHDDIAVLRRDTKGTLIELIHMGTNSGSPSQLVELQRADIQVPVQTEMLRMLDFNGDRVSDVAVYAPGLGVAVAVSIDTGGGRFVLVWSDFLPTGSTQLCDLQVGDLQQDGKDDLLLTFDEGILVIHGSQAPQSQAPSQRYKVFLRPTQLGKLQSCRLVPGAGRHQLILGIPKDRQALGCFVPDPTTYNNNQPFALLKNGYPAGTDAGAALVVQHDFDNDGDADLVFQHPDASHWLGLRNPRLSRAPLGLSFLDLGKAPKSEGAQTQIIEVTVQLPQSVIDAHIPQVEVALYAADPNSPKPNDPRYIYWGRVTPFIDPQTRTATFYTYHDDDDRSFNLRVADVIKKRALKLKTGYLTHPANELDTIRAGNGMFMQIHGLSGATRHENVHGKSPIKTGSAFAGRWTLISRPPSPTADLELLPWE